MFIDYSDPEKVIIKHGEERCTGRFHPNCFLTIYEKDNDYVFKVLSIIDPKKFIYNIVGYYPSPGTFPLLNSKEDLIKVIDALNKEYEKKFSSVYGFLRPEDLKDGDYIHIEDTVGFKAICIFKSFKDSIIKRYVFYNLNSGNIYIDVDGYKICSDVIKIKKATSKEIELLNNALEVQKGLVWNPHTKTLAVKESSWNQLREAREAIESPTIAEPTININDFIKEKKHYQLNFNN